MRPPRQTTRLLDALSSVRRRLVGASVGGLLAATVLPAVLLAVVQPPGKAAGPLGGSKLTLPLSGTKAASSFDEIKRREGIEGHLTPADIQRALIASRSQRKRILRAHPYFRVYKEAKRRYGVSWYLVAALHQQRKAMSSKAVMSAARRLRDAGAGSGLDRRAWRAVAAHYRTARTRRAQASLVLEHARAWKQLGVIPLPVDDKLASPVEGVVPGCGYFHCPRPGHLHNGLDLSAPVGTPIHAVQAGRVAILEDGGQSGGYGTFVCLQHAPSLASCYAHLSRFAPGLELGREVGRGEVIGLVGCTGHCFGAHLHFEIRRGAASCSRCAVDPVPYLSGKVPDVPAPKLGPAPRPPSLAPAPVSAPVPTAVALPAPTAAPAPQPAAPPVAAPRRPSVAPTLPSRQPGRQPALAPAPSAGGTAPAPPAPAPAPPPPADPAPPPDTGGATAPPPGR